MVVFWCPADRPWLSEGPKVQRLQKKVYLALQHSLQMSGASDEKLDMVSLILDLRCFRAG